MKHIIVSLACVLLLLLTACAHAGSNQPAQTAADEQAFQTIIEDQLAAFKADDAERAFAHATPDVRAKFTDADRFLRMVRQHFAPVYRPRDVSFGPAIVTPANSLQAVDVISQNGRVFTAIYAFEKQPDGAWKISGCYLMPRKAIAI